MWLDKPTNVTTAPHIHKRRGALQAHRANFIVVFGVMSTLLPAQDPWSLGVDDSTCLPIKELELEEPPDAFPHAIVPLLFADWAPWDPVAIFPHTTMDDSQLLAPHIIETKSNTPPISSETQPLSDLMKPRIFNVNDAFIPPSAKLPQWPLMDNIPPEDPVTWDEFDPNQFTGPTIVDWAALDTLLPDFRESQLR
jgi:hypothetical protein